MAAPGCIGISHTFSEITRAGLQVAVSPDAQKAGWHVGSELRWGTPEQRDAIVKRGWDRFVDGVRSVLPQPHAPLAAIEKLASFDRLSIAERLAELELSEEEHETLAAELESLAHAPLTDAGAVAVLRWHALSGYSLKLTQETGGRVTIVGGTGALLGAIADGAPFERRLATRVFAVEQRGDEVDVHTADGDSFAAAAVVVAVPLNTLRVIAFEPELADDKQQAIALGQASRGIKLMLKVRGEQTTANVIQRGHQFGYLGSEELIDGDEQLMIGFGPDAARCDAADLPAVGKALATLLPGYELLDATAHNWLTDEFSRGTWAIHRPGWYEHHHAAINRPDGRVLFAGSDLADGWAGFIDGAIESGLRNGARAVALSA